MTRIGPVLVLLCLLAAPAQGAPSVGEPVVYVSPGDTGDPPPSVPWLVPAQDGQALFLYIDYENSPDGGMSDPGGTMCVDADGDETCGFDVLLEMTSDAAVFANFTPSNDCLADPDCEIVGHLDPPTAPTRLRVNGIDITGLPGRPPGAPRAKIGTLMLDAAGANDLQIVVKGMHRVGAAGQLDAIQERVIVELPEPGPLWLLVTGAPALWLLARHRRRDGVP